jgi:soluble lytic murein transglycosylase-like protein
MPERGFRRVRLIAALTFAGMTGVAGGTLPTVVADDDTPAITTTVTGTPCPDAPLVDGQVVTVPDGEECPPATTGETPPPTTGETPPPTTGETPPPTTGETPPPTRDEPPAPSTADTALEKPAAHAPAEAPAPAKPATKLARPVVSDQPAARPVKHRPRPETRQRAVKDRTRARHHVAKQHPLHDSPYGGLAMHWTVRDPLGLNDFPKITLDAFPVPPFLLPIYQAAGAQYDIHWEILAAINEVETGFGSNLRESSAGAVGWMQFMPSSWARYGVDADGDGKADPWNPVDAIFAAARYLHAAGAESSLPQAIWAYNHAGWYVDQVIDRARTFAGLPEDLVAVLTREGFSDTKSVHARLGKDSYVGEDVKLTMPGQALLLSDTDLRHRVLADDKLDIYGCGREDIEAGRIDPRVLATLEYLRLSGFDPSVSALECGHSFLTRSGNVSEHSSGDAVDIPTINGTSVLGHQGPDSITDDVVRRLLRLQGLMEPHQIITLMTYPGADNTFSLPDHANHVHVGFRPMSHGR